MRIFVIGLVLLAGLKVWTQDRIYRSVAGEALVEAYRARAIEVCRKEAGQAANATHSAAAWNAASEAEVVIGNPNIDVAIWDTQNPRWNERFQHPNLVLTEAGDVRTRCAYDLHDKTATLSAG